MLSEGTHVDKRPEQSRNQNMSLDLSDLPIAAAKRQIDAVTHHRKIPMHERTPMRGCTPIRQAISHVNLCVLMCPMTLAVAMATRTATNGIQIISSAFLPYLFFGQFSMKESWVLEEFLPYCPLHLGGGPGPVRSHPLQSGRFQLAFQGGARKPGDIASLLEPGARDVVAVDENA